MTECPECGKTLRGRKCACGYETKLKTQEEKKHDAYESLRCRWMASRGQCRLVGVRSPSIGAGAPFYCPWHYECLNNPVVSEDMGEFMEFRKQEKREKFDERQARIIFNLSLGG